MTLKEIILLNVHPDSDSVVERPDSDSDSVQKSDRVHSPGGEVSLALSKKIEPVHQPEGTT